MARKQFFLTTFVVVSLMILLFGCGATSTSDPSIVWSDDFEDGDTQGWEHDPAMNISVNKGALATGLDIGGTTNHESRTSSGTWSFDLFFPEGKLTVYDICMSCDDAFVSGCGIRVRNGFKSQISGQVLDNRILQTNINQVTLDNPLTGWNHFDYTRDDAGNSRIFINGEFILEYQDALTFSPRWFSIIASQAGPGLDNLVVRNQVLDIPQNQ